MRLTSDQTQITKSTVNRVLGAENRVWLFGSRVDDDLRGGDIDLLVETDATFPNRAKVLCTLYGALILALGDRKLDVLLKDGRTADAPIFGIARRTGVML
ncbi:MAG: nucleotidyltransferase domain-containing protein [Gallionella sp.]|nr:nucleotidyltransferase domain-containing protein [Gallionella sp.]MDD4947133.1 nucleotidyltransferase domain-containing protein [Gallionella sp.]MDD5612690.1 nucleotidyltransferase domain-containing protein [Gallionella sp.]